MDTLTFISTFGLIFLAELGDKTQLTAMALAVRFPWKKIFIGIAAAFTILNLAAVVVGKILFSLLPMMWVALISAGLFLFFGVTTLIQSCSETTEEIPTDAPRHVIKTAFLMILMAELGDKTQLVTASQAAQHATSISSTLSVFLASTLALWSVSLIGIFVGKQLIRYIPLCWIHRAAGILFLCFGIALITRLVFT